MPWFGAGGNLTLTAAPRNYNSLTLANSKRVSPFAQVAGTNAFCVANPKFIPAKNSSFCMCIIIVCYQCYGGLYSTRNKQGPLETHNSLSFYEVRTLNQEKY